MASNLVDLVKISVNNNGTGAISLGAAVPGYRGIEALTNAKVYSYAIQQGSQYEVGRGTYLSSGQQLSRTVLYSSNGNAAINVQAGAQVAFVALAEDLDAVQLTSDMVAIEAAVLAAQADVVTRQSDVSDKQALAATNELNSAASATTATTQVGLATTQATIAAAAAGVLGVLPSTPAALPNEVLTVTGGVGTGSGGTPGEYAMVLTGGPSGAQVFGTIGGDGKVAGYRIANPGISVSSSAPTIAWPTGTGLTGATAPTATVGTIPAPRAFWGVTADSAYQALWINSAGVLTPVVGPDGSQIKRPIGSTGSSWITKSGLAELGSDARGLTFAITDPNKRVILAGFSDGGLSFKLDTTSPAATWVTSQIAANSAVRKSDMVQEFRGSAIGSTPPNALIYAIRDASNRFLFGVGYDGAFEVGKYDAKVQRAVLGASTAVPYIDESGGQIIVRYGAGTVTLTSEGTNSKPQRVGNRIAFLSDRYRSITQPYIMDADGSNQRAFQVDRPYEGFFITGQSLAAGYGTNAISNAVYPQNAYCLTGGPVHDGGSPATAPLISLREVTKETIATSFATAVLDSELAFRPENRLVLFGNPVSSTAYSGLKQGTTPYNNTLTEISNILAINPSFLVRGFGVIHGEQDAGSSTYATDLQTWQANYETDIKALTGQGESVIMFVCQTSSIRYYYPTTMNAHKSALAALAASVANSKVVFVCPEYFLTYQSDNLHITGASERLLGEYFAKAYRKVICEGRDWRGVSPRSFTLGSNYVDVQFWVPVAPLVLDTALCTDPGNYGFNYVDDSGRTISSVALKGGTTDTVRITLSGTIGTHAVLDYAYNNGTASTSGPTGGARGCLRDSDPALSRWDGATHLYNPCAIFQQALN